MAANQEIAYTILTARMDRAGLFVPAAQETYWKQRLSAAELQLNQMGIQLEDNLHDSTLLADFTADQLHNRDTTGEMPLWLRREVRDRWFAQARMNEQPAPEPEPEVGGDAT